MHIRGFAPNLVFVMLVNLSCTRSGSVTEQWANNSDQGAQLNAGTDARDLIPYVAATQKAYVRESTGIYAYECFTYLDLDRFKADSVPLRTSREAARSPRFRAIVAQLKILPDEQSKALLALARNVGHPTWAQMGRITRDGSGQTEAGQVAEKMIAEAIVRTAEEMLRNPNR